jgi:hypothetical protein
MEKITQINASMTGTINDLVRSVNELIDKLEALEILVPASACHNVMNRINLIGSDRGLGGSDPEPEINRSVHGKAV